jgi:hypothetical protein
LAQSRGYPWGITRLNDNNQQLVYNHVIILSYGLRFTR